MKADVEVRRKGEAGRVSVYVLAVGRKRLSVTIPSLSEMVVGVGRLLGDGRAVRAEDIVSDDGAGRAHPLDHDPAR
jgi:hypothetical protein